MQGPRTMPTAHRVIQHRSGTHDTEGPIAGISENESGNDIDRHCFLIEDFLIRSDCLKHFSSFLIRFATHPDLLYRRLTSPILEWYYRVNDNT
jgi:hypothetical protein